MDYKKSSIAVLVFSALALLTGCLSSSDPAFRDSKNHYQAMALQIEYPNAEMEHREDVLKATPPLSVLNPGKIEYWSLTLEEAVHIALNNSRVMREVGGTILNTPTASTTVWDPAIRETDPRGGTEAALSQFDALFGTGIFWGQNNRYFNNILAGGGNRNLHQDIANFEADITKIAATGTQFTMRNTTLFDRNNALFNVTPQTYTTIFQGEVRHPLLQGGGIEFNRIAGPLAKPGAYNGVVLARINTDITLADFEAAVRDLLYNVERTYWELYVAYRELDARRAGRDSALQTWQDINRKMQAGTSDHEQEARAREQYYLFETQSINALNGATPAAQGGAPGSLPTGLSSGVYSVERRLRYLMGLPSSDGRLVRPADAPSTVPSVFDWCNSLEEALTRRVELRRQKWVVKRRELELVAAKNFLLMRLDLVGQYGYRGVGEDLFGDTGVPHGSAFEDLFEGNQLQWQLGLQLTTPIGNRIGHTTVRNAEFTLCRERAIYREQELRVSHDLSEALADLDRAYAVVRSQYNGRLASHQQLDEIRKKYDAGLAVPLEFLLDAQRRAVESDSAYYRSLVDYNMAIASVQRARGSLLDYHSVYLAEGPWSDEAHASAAKQSRRFRPRVLNYVFEVPCAVSAGTRPEPLTAPASGPTPFREEQTNPPMPAAGARG